MTSEWVDLGLYVSLAFTVAMTILSAWPRRKERTMILTTDDPRTQARIRWDWSFDA